MWRKIPSKIYQDWYLFSYELFKIKERESIHDLVNRFDEIINGKKINKIFLNEKLNWKVLRSLTNK